MLSVNCMVTPWKQSSVVFHRTIFTEECPAVLAFCKYRFESAIFGKDENLSFLASFDNEH